MKQPVCLIYARVSVAGKQETLNQIRQLKEFTKKQRWKLYAVLQDEESGATAGRSAFQEVFTLASQKKYDVLLFWSLDRLTREGALATLRYLDQLTQYGVAFRSFTQQYIDSLGPFRDSIVAILADLAAQERQVISARTKAGLQRAVEQGKKLGRPTVDVPEDEKLDHCIDRRYSYRRAAAYLKLKEKTAERLIKRRMEKRGLNVKAKKTNRHRRRFHGYQF